jgi:uncharacterized protein
MLDADEQHLVYEKDLDDLLADLRAMEAELRAKGVTEVNLFGSRSRHDYRPDSDVDLLVRMEEDSGRSAFVAFALQDFIATRLRANVHVVSVDGVRPDKLHAFESQSIIVF